MVLYYQPVKQGIRAKGELYHEETFDCDVYVYDESVHVYVPHVLVLCFLHSIRFSQSFLMNACMYMQRSKEYSRET